MSLPPILRIKKEDVVDAPAWFEPFLDKLNQELEYLRAAFDHGIVIGENVQGRVKVLQVRTKAGYENGAFDVVRFPSGVPGKLNACDVKQVIDLADPDAVLAGPFCADWRDVSGECLVRWISGLAPSRPCQLRLHLW